MIHGNLIKISYLVKGSMKIINNNKTIWALKIVKKIINLKILINKNN